MASSLSIVIPVFNESDEDLRSTLLALGEDLAGSSWSDPEIVIVDDGSDTPIGTPEIPGAGVRVVRQENLGRFEARRTGIEAARGEYVLLLDSRIKLVPGSLAWVSERVRDGQRVWNGHVDIENLGSPFPRFWNVLTYATFSEYFARPRTTSFGLEEYDRFPKGTSQFLAPRSWLLDAIEEFESRYADMHFCSDDTHMLRAIAARDRIHISPSFASLYTSREALVPFLGHAMYRGTTFYDGFGRPGTRFFPVVVASLPLSIGGALLALRRPRLGLAGALGVTGAGVAFARRLGRPAQEVRAFGLLTAPFAVAFSIGIWRGVWLAAKHKLTS